jgi:ABC-type nitrate/sulfonate/bicarbonate transport system ATPase subunit
LNALGAPAEDLGSRAGVGGLARRIDMGAKSPLLLVDDLTVRFSSRGADEIVAIQNLTLSVGHAEFVTVVGPSGCGKSTLLGVIDGLVDAQGGRVLLRGRQVSGPGPDRAMVFQDSALFPWRTVQSNVEFGLQMRGERAEKRREVARRYLQMVGLTRFARHYPHQLSGGMRQRVGIARALAVNPEILLMDEPFGALDAQTRELMGGELLRIWDQERKMVIFVTHSIEEAIYLGDRVIVLTARPARLKKDLPIDLPRPRDQHIRTSPEFTRYRQIIWDLLEEEVTLAQEVSMAETP